MLVLFIFNEIFNAGMCEYVMIN